MDMNGVPQIQEVNSFSLSPMKMIPEGYHLAQNSSSQNEHIKNSNKATPVKQQVAREQTSSPHINDY